MEEIDTLDYLKHIQDDAIISLENSILNRAAVFSFFDQNPGQVDIIYELMRSSPGTTRDDAAGTINSVIAELKSHEKELSKLDVKNFTADPNQELSLKIDFSRILAFYRYMSDPKMSDPEMLDPENDIAFLLDILTKYKDEETYFYYIIKNNIDGENNIDEETFDEIYDDFFTIILSYLNTLITTSSINAPIDFNRYMLIGDRLKLQEGRSVGQNDVMQISSNTRYNEDKLLKKANADILAGRNKSFFGQVGEKSVNPFSKKIQLDIEHYQDFLNQQILSNLPNLSLSDDRDFLKKFVNEFKISPDPPIDPIDPIDPHGPHDPPFDPLDPHGPPLDLDDLRNQENSKCKYAFTHYIDKLIQKKNYPGVYLLLLLYIQMFSDSTNPNPDSKNPNPEEIQVDVNILEEIQVDVNILLFYTTYKTLLNDAPILMDNISHFLAIKGDRDRMLDMDMDTIKLTNLYKIYELLDAVIFNDMDTEDVERKLSEIIEANKSSEDQDQEEALEEEALEDEVLEDEVAKAQGLGLGESQSQGNTTGADDSFISDIEEAKEAERSKRKGEIPAFAPVKRPAKNTAFAPAFAPVKRPAKNTAFAAAFAPVKRPAKNTAFAAAFAAAKKRGIGEEVLAAKKKTPLTIALNNSGNEASESDADASDAYASDSDGGSANKGGQVGGNCEFNEALLNSMHVIKMLEEAGHDLTGERSDKSVYNGQTISAAKINNVVAVVNLYEKMYGVLKSFVTGLNLANLANLANPDNLADQYEYHFLDDLKGKIITDTKVDENKYLHSIVKILTEDCLDVVDNFFFYNSIHFSLRDLENNGVSYSMLKQKIITTYPQPDWWLVADVNTYTKLGVKYSDLYLYVIKKEDRPPIDTTFKLYEQDMGLGDISDIAFREIDYFAAYEKLFPDGSTNDIDLFFYGGIPNLSVEFKLNEVYTSDTMAAKEKNKTGEIKVVGGKIDITSVWAIDIAKQFDPLSVENPPYGQIFNDPIEQGLTNSITGFNKMYIGYPNSLPIDRYGNVGPVPTSSDFFNQQVDALGPDDASAVVVAPEIKIFLKDLNAAAITATLFAFNTLLNFWIDFPGEGRGIVDNYNLILENGNIIGFRFTSTVVLFTFTFTAHIADCTVTNICYAMIQCANDWDTISEHIAGANPIYEPGPPVPAPVIRIIQQMINIMRHPNYKYPAQKSNLDYALTIIATIKSFGDESQLLAKTKLQAFLDRYVELNKSSKNLFLKTSDRPLVGHLLLYLQSFIAELLVPHRSFGQQEEITDKIPTVFNPKTSKDVTIYNVNASIISNAANVITIVKTTYERLLEIPAEYRAACDLLLDKLPVPVSTSSSSPPFLDKIPEIQAYVDKLQKSKAAKSEAAKSEAASTMDTTDETDQEAEEVAQLKKFRDYIAEIKQILISLEYYTNNTNLDAKPLKTITEGYLDLQIKTAVSKSIPSVILTDITVFNNKHGINKIKDITDALRNMYNNLDFYSRIFDLHDIACELFIEKLNMYINIINNSSLDLAAKKLVTDHYKLLIAKVTDINNTFVEEAKKKLEENIASRELKATRGRSNKNTGSTTIPDEGSSAEELQKLKTAKGTEAKVAQTKADQLTVDILKAKNDWNTAELQLIKTKADLLAAEADVAKAKKEIKDAKKDQIKKSAAELKLTAAEIIKKDAEKRKKDADADEKVKKAALKVFEKQETGNNSVIADIIKSANILSKKLNIAVLSAAASSHDVASDVAKSILNLFGRGRLISKGGQKSRQNKQKYKKKYTKHLRKKIYRKKTQKQFKIKRPKRTKKNR
jgi:hypothetical protein